MSAMQHSLNLDKSLCTHYYHCVLFDIPFHTPVSEIAPHVVPKRESGIVQKLAAAGCRPVPHQLHVFKEPLDAKFGYVTFFIHQLPNSSATADEIHRLVLEWISLDLASQLQSVKCKVQLAQPPECHSSEPFLSALEEKCPLLDPGMNPDTKRLETFILTRVRFGDLHENASINEANEVRRRISADACRAKEEEDERRLQEMEKEEEAKAMGRGNSPSRHSVKGHVWRCVGAFSPNSLSPKELLWLKKQLPSFPPLLITDNNVETTHCDEALLRQFFAANLAPLISLEE